jgi:hypothetical protein
MPLRRIWWMSVKAGGDNYTMTTLFRIPDPDWFRIDHIDHVLG